MRYSPTDPTTGNAAKSPFPPNVQHKYYPRIRCHDCPGKLYTPLDMSVENFEVHLKNRQHRERVDTRTRSF